MNQTKHAKQRMSQRGIKTEHLGLVMEYGRVEVDRYVLDKRLCREKIEELKYLQKKLEHVSKKGGLTVAAKGSRVITAFRTSSFSRNCTK